MIDVGYITTSSNGYIIGFVRDGRVFNVSYMWLLDHNLRVYTPRVPLSKDSQKRCCSHGKQRYIL
jgi:hypothetical protein